MKGNNKVIPWNTWTRRAGAEKDYLWILSQHPPPPKKKNTQTIVALGTQLERFSCLYLKPMQTSFMEEFTSTSFKTQEVIGSTCDLREEKSPYDSDFSCPSPLQRRFITLMRRISLFLGAKMTTYGEKSK